MKVQIIVIIYSIISESGVIALLKDKIKEDD